MTLRVALLLICFCWAGFSYAQQAALAAAELDRIWSILQSEEPYSIRMEIVYIDESSPERSDTNVVVIRGHKNQLQYTMDNDIEVAYGNGIIVEVYKPEQTIYITEDTFRRPPVSQFGIFKLMAEDSSTYKCTVTDISDGKKKLEYRLTGSANPYTAFYYSSNTYKPDSAVMEIVTDYDPYEDKVTGKAKLHIRYTEFHTEATDRRPGPDNIVRLVNGVWTPTSKYTGYTVKFLPVLNINK